MTLSRPVEPSHPASHGAPVLWRNGLDDRRRAEPEGTDMALFMDAHNIEGGVSAADVAAAHQADLATQDAHGVNYLRYWVDEAAGKIFCLVDAPDAEAANTV